MIGGCNGGSYGYTLHVQLLDRQGFLVNLMANRGTGDAADTQRKATPLKTIQHFYRIDRRDISYLRFILEAYDGMAVLTTRDAARGIVSVTIAPGRTSRESSSIDGAIHAIAGTNSVQS